MPAYTTQDIRNIALVGQSGAGKNDAGRSPSVSRRRDTEPGTIERGDTVCDFESQGRITSTP